MMVQLSAEEAIRTRRSIRAFLPTPIPRQTVEHILTLASRSASGSNIQPWKVRVIAGDKRLALSKSIHAALDHDGADAHQREWNYYPENWREPFIGRRRKIGWDLYGLMGIRKGDFEATEKQRRRNYDFFDAPVALVFTLDEDLEIGSWLDLGIYLGAVMIAARGLGLDTCPQAALANVHKVLRAELGIPPNEVVICGMGLGYEDPSAPENKLVTERAPASEFATFDGF
ncbi:MAG: nitroreductase [Usitatibacter sp.]